MLLYHNGKPRQPATVHLFAFAPWRSARRQQELCLYLRVRRGTRIRHFRIGAYWPRKDLRVGPRFGMGTLEAKTWLTDLNEQSVGHLKTFIRLKAGIGGPPRDGQRIPRERPRWQYTRRDATRGHAVRENPFR